MSLIKTCPGYLGNLKGRHERLAAEAAGELAEARVVQVSACQREGMAYMRPSKRQGSVCCVTVSE